MATYLGGLSGPFSFEKLNKENYESWKEQVKWMMIEKSLWEHVNGQAKISEHPTAEQIEKWNIAANRAHATLCMGVSHQLQPVVANTTNAKEAWESIKTYFEPVSKVRIIEGRLEFQALTPNADEDIALYVMRVHEVAQKLKDLGLVVSDLEITCQMIDKLPQEYQALVQAMYHWSDYEFTSENVGTQLIAEAARLRHQNEDQTLNHSKAFTTNTRPIMDANRPKKIGYKQGPPSHMQRLAKLCYTCGKAGHFARDCYQGDNRRIKNNQDRPEKNSNVTQRYNQRSPSGDRQGSGRRKVFVVAAPTQGGKQVTFNDDTMGSNVKKENLWYIDGGATDHICFRRELFQTFKEVTPFPLTLGEGTSMVTGVGEIDLLTKIEKEEKPNTITLTNVYYAPNFTLNLISMARIDEAGCAIHVENGQMKVYDMPSKESVCVAHNQGHLYKLNTFGKDAEKINQGIYLGVTQDNVERRPQEDNGYQWHLRLGHLHYEGIRKLMINKNVYGINNGSLSDQERLCEICAISKATRVGSKSFDDIRSTRQLELLHMDVCGPMRQSSFGGARYFLTITDDYSRYSFLYVLKKKNEVFQFFEKFYRRMDARYKEKIAAVRTDNGTEFCNKAFQVFFEQHGIRHERTNPYSPEMNGVAERLNRTIMEGVRALIVENNFPEQLWAELALTIVYLKNRFPHSRLKGEVPYIVWHERKLALRHLRVPGCITYVTKTNPGRSKLTARAWTGVMIGYAVFTKGYRIWNPNTNEVIESKHVNFDERTKWTEKQGNLIHSRVLERLYDLNEDEEENEDETTKTQKVESVVTEQEQDTNDERQLETLSGSHKNESEWTRREVKRKTGKTKGEIDVYYYPPDETKGLRSRPEIMKYCLERNIAYDPQAFDFSRKKQHGSRMQTDEDNVCFEDSQAPNVEINSVRIDPETYEKAVNSEEFLYWKRAMDEEIKILQDRKVYEEVERPINSKILGNKWVYKTKLNTDGKIKRYRARMVAQGFRQTFGTDYDEVFSPVVNFVLIRLFFMLLVVMTGWIHLHLDVQCAYLYGDLDKPIFMEKPKGYSTQDDKVWILKKALYGLHQSGREWYKKLDTELQILGFEKLKGFNCVYLYGVDAVLLVYVDDLVLFSRNNKCKDEIVRKISNVFDIVDLGPVKTLLGVKFEKIGEHMYMHQKPYIEKLSREFNISEVGKPKSPMGAGQKADTDKKPTRT